MGAEDCRVRLFCSWPPVCPSPQLFCLVFGTGIVFSLYLWAFIPLKHSHFSLGISSAHGQLLFHGWDGDVLSVLSWEAISSHSSFSTEKCPLLFQGGRGWICPRCLSSPLSAETKGHFVVDGYNPFLLLFHASTHIFKSKQYCREFVFQENPFFSLWLKLYFKLYMELSVQNCILRENRCCSWNCNKKQRNNRHCWDRSSD